MIAFLVTGVLGLASLPLWPGEWRLALGLGWGLSLAAEALLARKRQQVLTNPGSRGLILMMTFGFLGRLALLLFGMVAGKLGELFPLEPFFGAFLAALAVGEALSLTALQRARARVAEQRRPTP